LQKGQMILQMQSSVLCDLLATESGPTSHLEAMRDALQLAQANLLTPPNDNSVSNDRTNLPKQKR